MSIPKCPECHSPLTYPSSTETYTVANVEMTKAIYDCYCGKSFVIRYPTNDVEEQEYEIRKWNDYYSPEWW